MWMGQSKRTCVSLYTYTINIHIHIGMHIHINIHIFVWECLFECLVQPHQETIRQLQKEGHSPRQLAWKKCWKHF